MLVECESGVEVGDEVYELASRVLAWREQQVLQAVGECNWFSALLHLNIENNQNLMGDLIRFLMDLDSISLFYSIILLISLVCPCSISRSSPFIF